MNHSKIHWLVLVLLVCVGGGAFSQDVTLDQARAELQAGRDRIIRQELQLSDEELAEFWPIYQEYVARLGLVRDRKATLIRRFVEAYDQGEFSDEFAEWIISENFAIKHAWAGMQEDFLPRFRQVLPVQKVARFYQLENKLDAEVDARLALVIPLVE